MKSKKVGFGRKRGLFRKAHLGVWNWRWKEQGLLKGTYLESSLPTNGTIALWPSSRGKRWQTQSQGIVKKGLSAEKWCTVRAAGVEPRLPQGHTPSNFLRFAIAAAIYRSLEGLWARNPQNVSKGCSSASQPGVSEKCRKSPKWPEKESKRLQNQYLGTFRHFFDSPGREGREHLFETFWGFRGSGVWRLLYMGIAIVILGVVLPHLPCETFRACFIDFVRAFPVFSWTL